MRVLAFQHIFPQGTRSVFAELVQVREPMGAHGHDFWELAFAIKGSGQHEDQRACLPVLAGDVWLIRPGQWHAYPCVKHTLSIFNLLFTTEFVYRYQGLLSQLALLAPLACEDDLEELERPPRFLRLSPQGLEQIYQLLSLLALEAQQKRPGQEAVCSGLVLQILGLLERYTTGEPLLSQTLLLVRHDPGLLRVVQYIEDGYAEELTLDLLARQSGYAVTHLARKFRQALGTSPMEYVLQVRLHHACCLLRTSEYQITRIAHEVGFVDSRYFATRFRATLGMTPSQFREQERHQAEF